VEQQVEVIAVEGDQAVVSGKRATACGGCAGKSSCSTLGSWNERLVELRVKNRLSAIVGDRVTLDVPEGLLLKVAFRLYAVPMLAFILAGLVVRSVAIEQGLAHAELLAALAGLLAVVASFAWQLFSPASKKLSLDVRMTKIVQPSRLSSHSISVAESH